MPLAGQRVLAGDFPAVASDVQNVSGTTASTGYVETLTGGTPAAATFVAPTSGKVEISYGCQLSNSAAVSTYMSVVVRTGGVIGSGTVVAAASDDSAVILTATVGTSARIGVSQTITGLTPGATYNVRQAFKVNSGTGTYARKYLTVKPLP